ncbi:MAG: DUF1501 domain-containing protein, partial [Verrucomicrobiota bacterium]|nr:DUF1501 domain-containing protein [Verrucomicrobiota bacterium]
MLELFGKRDKKNTHCDGYSRRNFLKIGGMAAGGLSLDQLMAMEAKSGTSSSHKSIINIYLPGGPSHLDMFDLKPDAPSEIRGEFKPIRTNVPGMQICEMFPRLAKIADKFAIVRSISDSDGAHDCYQCMTGHKKSSQSPAGGWPSFGSWVSKIQGSNPGVPANLSLMYPTGNRTWGEAGTGGFIGTAHGPMGLVDKDPNTRAKSLTLKGMSLERLMDRETLRSSVDQMRRDVDATGQMSGLDNYNKQALEILSDSGLANALDIS